jgi:uncharacterized protein YyaL (SSP411 family)
MKDDYDGAEPAAASVAVANLLTLGHIVSDAALEDRARRTLERYGPQVGRAVRVMPLMVANVILWNIPASQVVLVGAPRTNDFQALERAVADHYLPATVVITRAGVEDNPVLTEKLPWLAAMKAVGGRAAAYVCRAFACQAPITEKEALDHALAELSSPRRIVG